MRSQNYEDPALGNNIMIAGVAFQVFTLGLFMTLCADFAARVWMNGRSGNALNKNDEELRNSRRFRGFLAALTLATVCIMIRSM